MHPGHTFLDVFAGKLTGAVYQWSPGDADFTKIKGSELPGNNGIEVSADEQEIYVVSSGMSTVSVYANANPTKLLRATPRLDFGPDNIHLDAAGQLVTAGPSDYGPTCPELDAADFSLEDFASCPKGFVAATIDPETMVVTEIARGPTDPLFSNATMAIQVGEETWVGSFADDRIAIIRGGVKGQGAEVRVAD